MIPDLKKEDVTLVLEKSPITTLCDLSTPAVSIRSAINITDPRDLPSFSIGLHIPHPLTTRRYKLPAAGQRKINKDFKVESEHTKMSFFAQQKSNKTEFLTLKHFE